MSNRYSLSAEPGRESLPGQASAEPSNPFRSADRGGDVPVLASVALALVLLAGIGYALLMIGGRSRADVRPRRSAADPGSARSGRDSLLPAARSILTPRNHHQTLHDPKYLDRILRAELEQGSRREAPGAAEPGESGQGDAGSGPGNAAQGDDPRS